MGRQGTVPLGAEGHTEVIEGGLTPGVSLRIEAGRVLRAVHGELHPLSIMMPGGILGPSADATELILEMGVEDREVSIAEEAPLTIHGGIRDGRNVGDTAS